MERKRRSNGTDEVLPEGGNGMSDICSDDGAVKVSTGMGKRDKRAAAPDRHKTGNFIN